ncbi:MAG: hypothetical protein CMN28_08140 [Salinisphaeraceae bacterium]|nr:hypothetical protein [Salinisphaeraceae bacterium]
MNIQRLSYALIAFLVISLSACGGSTGGGDDPVDPNDPNNPTDPVDPVDPNNPTIRLGSFDNSANFTQGTIAANDTMLTAGESAALSVSLVDDSGNPVTENVDVFFSSPCVGQGLSELDQAVVTNATGTVNVTYTARGCDPSDTVTAATSVNGVNLTASVTLQTEQAPVGSIQFTGVSQPVIGIQGSGSLPEQSVVTFRLTNNTSGPVPNRQVNFNLNTTVGGISLSNMQGTTDSNGVVSTTVNSGTVATTVRITASALRDNGSTTSAQSSGLAITTGIPDQDSFSVSATVLNIEGWDIDGTTTTITARAADRFNNPVPDGTAVNFTTEGGSVFGSCLTAAGACSVDLTSQSPRPADGRVTVRVSAIGEESFSDTTPSNGVFDSGEAFDDLPEAFRDDNENGVRDATEPFLDFGGTPGTYDMGNGLFTGLLCDPAANAQCDTADTLNVFRNITIVFSGSTFVISIDPSTIDLTMGGRTVNVSVVDARGQVPPAGTTISAETSIGTIEGPSNYTQASTTSPGPAVFPFFLSPGDQPDTGRFTVTVTTPSGLVQTLGATVSQ